MPAEQSAHYALKSHTGPMRPNSPLPGVGFAARPDDTRSYLHSTAIMPQQTRLWCVPALRTHLHRGALSRLASRNHQRAPHMGACDGRGSRDGRKASSLHELQHLWHRETVADNVDCQNRTGFRSAHSGSPTSSRLLGSLLEPVKGFHTAPHNVQQALQPGLCMYNGSDTIEVKAVTTNQ